MGAPPNGENAVSLVKNDTLTPTGGKGQSAPGLREMPNSYFSISHFPKESFVQNAARMRKIALPKTSSSDRFFRKKISKSEREVQLGSQGPSGEEVHPP